MDVDEAKPGALSSRFTGYCDRYDAGGRASGWVTDLVNPHEIVVLRAIIDGRDIATVTCDGVRDDVRGALNLASPQVGFSFDIPHEFLDGEPHVLSLLLPDDTHLQHMGEEGIAALRPSFTFADTPLVTVQGNVDGLVHNALRGWVLRRVGRDPVAQARCDILITCENVKIAQIKADRFRRDVGNVLGCDPNCGFEFTVPHAFQKNFSQTFRFFLLPEMIELNNSPFVTATVSDFLEGKLVSIASDMSRMYADMERLRREITSLLPSQGYHLGDYDRWARRYYENLRARVAAERQLLRQALVRPGKIDRIFITRRSAETCFGLPGGPQSFPQPQLSSVRLCLRVPSSDSSIMTEPSCCCGRRSYGRGRVSSQEHWVAFLAGNQ